MSDPYCSACGYSLKGVTESSKCPECGRPLVEVLMRKTFDPVKLGWGKRYRSKIMLFGLPLIHIALGPSEDGPKGKARGIVAIGDQARGLIAMGGNAIGVIAFGGLACGLFSMGGLSFGLMAIGGAALGGMTWGGASIGLIATGGGSLGYIATGGAAFGYYVGGGGGWGKYLLTPNRRDTEAVALFQDLSWLLGSGSPINSMITPLGWMLVALVGLLLIVSMLMLFAYLRHDSSTDTQ